jgi:hypothetical protein
MDVPRRSGRVSTNHLVQGGASLQRGSANRKIAPQRFEHARDGRRRNVPVGPFVATTHVSIEATCPSTCVFRDGTCYAIAGLHRQNGASLDDHASGSTGDEVIDAEVHAIDHTWILGVPQDGPGGAGRPLRLHVAGDTSSTRATRRLAGAARRWLARGGGPVWTYTHRWKRIPADAWGPISVLASVESAEGVREAWRRGYVPALTVPEYPNGRRVFRVGGVTFVPCPAEVGRITCAQCRLCTDVATLRARRLGIAFAWHGTGLVRLRARGAR